MSVAKTNYKESYLCDGENYNVFPLDLIMVEALPIYVRLSHYVNIIKSAYTHTRGMQQSWSKWWIISHSTMVRSLRTLNSSPAFFEIDH